ncbi:MAG TPA: alpha/beta hydrolase [Acidocella sp.]|nr:alpha/beta hydrolase [Acidocella sp.]
MTASKTQIVFIPALLCDAALYAPVIENLGDQFETHVMISPKPSLAESVKEILASAPDKFVLVGTSYAGNLALEIAIAAPERVTALWLMGCNPAAAEPGGPDLAAGLTATPDAVIDMLGGIIAHPNNPTAAATFKAMAHRIGGAAGALQATALGSRPDAVSRFGALTMPAFVLWGADDALVPVAVGKAMADQLPHAHFHVLPACGHLPTLEKPEESAALFTEFLRGEIHYTH